MPPGAGTDLEQLQQLLARCMDLSKEVTKPDAEWARELLQQLRIEFKRQRREQRKPFQQLITDIRELMEKSSRRMPPAEPATKRRRPIAVEICSDEEGEHEEHATALFVADTSGALSLLVGVPTSGAAESWSSPRVARSVAELEDRPSEKARLPAGYRDPLQPPRSALWERRTSFPT